MIPGVVLSAVLVVSLIFLYFWRFKEIRLSVFETLKQVAEQLPLKEVKFQKYPLPSVRGVYFGFRIILEGGGKKGAGNPRTGYRFQMMVDMPGNLPWRLFLMHEGRKTSFKPISELKLVPTAQKPFDDNFLLLASDEKKARNVFQTYLCEKVLSVPLVHWQLDVQGEEAHLDLFQETLNGDALTALIEVVVECLNSLLVT